MADQIEHRCGLCRFWKRGDQPYRGLCCLKPPIPITEQFGKTTWRWPTTNETDGCGEWTVNEELDSAE